MVRRRQKASEVHRKTNFLFRSEVSFDKAFPTVKALRVEVEQTGEGARDLNGEPSRKYFYTESSPPDEYIDCTNPLCFKGGVAILPMIRFMVERGDTDLETTETCQGYEGSPKGRKKHRECLNHFKVKIHLEFKS